MRNERFIGEPGTAGNLHEVLFQKIHPLPHYAGGEIIKIQLF